MSNEKNLKKGVKTRFKAGAEQAEIARKAGIASGEARRANKKLKTIANLILDSSVKDKQSYKYLKKEIDNIADAQITRGALILAKIFMKANSENATLADLMKAFELLRDTAGQKPTDKQEITNIDQDGYRQVLMGDEDIFAGDFGSADEADEK